MDIYSVDKMNIAGVLMSNGINPEKANSQSFWFCSPLRNEKTASFKVDRVKNVWYDYSSGTGGRLIDLVCKMFQTDISGSLLILSGATVKNPPLSFFDQPEESTHESKAEIKHIQPLQNRALLHYLMSRNINPSLAAKYCKEAYYKTTANEKQYFSLCFENDSHGHELRNKYFKGSTSPKAITTIPGANQTAVNVFEGFMDYLSGLTYFKTDRASCTTIVLNGVGFVDKLIEILPNYTKINLWIDNDQAGQKATRLIQDKRPEAVNRSKILYPNHKDFNEFINSNDVND